MARSSAGKGHRLPKGTYGYRAHKGAKRKLYIGVDIGGTKVRAGLVTADGRILRTAIVPTQGKEKPAVVVGNICLAINLVMPPKRKRVAGIGIGCPGPLDLQKGIIYNAPTLHKLHRFNIKRAIEKRLRRKVFLDNDANVFALAEHRFGAAKGCKNALMFTLGTGLGCGLVVDGKLHRGSTGMGAEIGQAPYRDGIAEDCISGRAIVALYKKFSSSKKPIRVSGKKFRSKGNRKNYKNAKEIANNATSDAACAKAYREFGKHLALMAVAFIDLIDPEIVVLGGSISKAHRLFMGEFERELRRNIHFLPAKHLKIRLAKLRDDAAILGAATMAMGLRE